MINKAMQDLATTVQTDRKLLSLTLPCSVGVVYWGQSSFLGT